MIYVANEIKPELAMKSYKLFIEKITPYKIIYDGSADGNILFIMTEKTPEDPNEPKYVFLDCLDGVPLSLDGFKGMVLVDRRPMDFEKLLNKRIPGCTVTKSGLICGLLLYNYCIDDIYDSTTKTVKIPKQSIQEISDWINFKGGMSAMQILEIQNQKRIEAEKRAKFEKMRANRAKADLANRVQK